MVGWGGGERSLAPAVFFRVQKPHDSGVRGGLDAMGGAAPALRRFALGLRRRYVLGCALSATARWGMLLSLPVVVVAWSLPSFGWHALCVGVAALLVSVLLVMLRAWQRSRRLFASLQHGLAGCDEGAAAFQDELLTWLELDRLSKSSGDEPVGEARAGMLRWLERDVHLRLQPHRREAQRAMTRLRLGRWKRLLPAALALLVLWLFSLWLQPPWPGVVGGRPEAPAPGAALGDGAQEPRADERAGTAEGAPGTDPEEAPIAPQPEPAALAAVDDGEEPRQDEPAEVPPLVEAPVDQRFVLPDFIGDGPTRRQRMHVAELEQQQPGGAARPQAQQQQTAGSRPRRPRPTSVEFERAAERAMRSRFVPERERAIVRRFFDALQKRGNH